MQHNPLSDTMSKIKNAAMKGKSEVSVRPASKLIGRVLKIMQDYDYIREFEIVEDAMVKSFHIYLNPTINNCGIITPRFPVKLKDIEKYEMRYLPAQNFGILIMTTNRGVLSNNEARELGVGGKLLAYVY